VAGLVSFIGGDLLYFNFQYFPLLTIILSALLAFFLTKNKKSLLILVIAAGFVYSFIRYVPPVEFEKEGLAIIKCLPGPPVYRESGFFQLTQNLRVKEGRFESGGPVRRDSLITHPASALREDTVYELFVSVKNPEVRLNPGAPKTLRGAGGEILKILSTRPANFIEKMRARLNTFYRDNFPPQSAGFLMAMTTGERALLDEKLWDTFNRAGIGHLLSISGTHFAIFSLFIFLAAKFFFKLLPLRILTRITLYVTPSQAGALLTFPIISTYLLLSGGDVPALRSFFMIALSLLALLTGRKRAWLNALALAAFLLVLWDPAVLFDISFQLSFLAVLFIGMFTDREWKIKNPFKKYLIASLGASLSATLGLLPLTAFRFHTASFISPLANLVAVPLTGFLLVPAAVFSSFSYLITGIYVFPSLSEFFSSLTLKTAKAFSSVPFSSAGVPAIPAVLVIFFYMACAFYFLFKRKKWVLLSGAAPLLLSIIFLSLNGKISSVTLLDTGDAESSVIELPDGKLFVLDTGQTGRELASYLKYRGEGTIDALILSHPHSDHTGGVERVLSSFKVKEMWDNGRISYEGDIFEKTPRKALSRGDLLRGKGYSLTVLHPYPGYVNIEEPEYLEENDSSLVLLLEAEGAKLLLGGDVELEGEEDLAELGPLLKSDVLKVPHHGSKYSAYEPFLDAVSPSAALISVGGNNRFGHPDEEMLSALDGAEIFRTDIDGALRVELGRRVRVKKFRDYSFTKNPGPKGELHNLRMLFSTF
jgi:competence protein ComEC